MSKTRKLDPTILREYDIRGITSQNLTVDDVLAAGRAFGTIVVGQGGKTVAVAYDGRLSSPGLEAAMCEGLAECGLKVIRCGLGPTPMLYFATHTTGADAGAMITGSHNPPEYNGIKMVLGGKSFFGDDIKNLGRVAATGDFAAGHGSIVRNEIIDDYVARLLVDFRSGKPLSVAWDAGNGSAGEALQKLCAELPGRHVLLNEKIDGTFPAHHPDPTVEKNLEQLKQVVAQEKCDLGIAFDGDGDRIGMIDGRGRVLWGDQIMIVLAREVLEDLPGATIIADVKASQVFFDEIKRMGGNPVMSATGHSLIKSRMQELNAPLAGEMSAHIFFSHRYYGFDDAMYAAVRMLSIVGNSDQSLAEMRDAIPSMVNTPEIRFDCDEARKFQVIEEVKERLARLSDIQVIDIDGVRVQSNDGWWLLRASNTQAALVARCESDSHEGLSRLKSTLIEQLGLSNIKPDLF